MIQCVYDFIVGFVFFFFSSRRRHTRCREVSWARRCVQETGINAEYMGKQNMSHFQPLRSKLVKFSFEDHLKGHSLRQKNICTYLRQRKSTSTPEKFTHAISHSFNSAVHFEPSSQINSQIAILTFQFVENTVKDVVILFVRHYVDSSILQSEKFLPQSQNTYQLKYSYNFQQITITHFFLLWNVSQ
eukprot:TRINITY_DN5273_c0_g1_i2.p1 TRINITY_DN5273_c0_g1~~TRINITY_DN5273_c0_g1_i2.p1  ORF type:complete len:187 (-),score=18.20 TRINITY_DN5273_c0_g1_i2:637-1197(-)